jgi:RIO kinase 1
VGPVIIDLPQAINTSHAHTARDMLIRDMDNLKAYFGRFAKDVADLDYGREIWALYQNGKLKPGVVLTGRVEHEQKPVDLTGVMRVIDLVLKKEAAWQRYKMEAATRSVGEGPAKRDRQRRVANGRA